jgi:release factor glutamine methyltransferase
VTSHPKAGDPAIAEAHDSRGVQIAMAADTGSPHPRGRQTIADARRAITVAFREAALDSPELDARILVGHALGLDHAALNADAVRVLTDPEREAISVLAARRLRREPVARIVGCKEFWGLPLRLNEATLVPRPETETVVEAALAAIHGAGTRSGALRIADLGTGSGALLLALLSELPNATGTGTDLNPAALACARENARRLGFGGRASFLACNYGTALAGAFDLVVSNPPYIAHCDLAALQPEVREHDPSLALDGGADGLDGYRAVARDASRLLAPAGVLVVELGAGLCEAACAIFAAAGLAPEPPRADLLGVPRALTVRRP